MNQQKSAAPTAPGRTRTALGKFITFEGGEGTGKSTQARLLAERLATSGIKTLLTREPGGSKKAEQIRTLLLSGRIKHFGPFAEALMFSLARLDHLEKAIRPALRKGLWVVCDRFSDSTRAYQGAAGGLDQDVVEALERVVVGRTRPQLTIILDLPPEIGLERAKKRATDGAGKQKSGDPAGAGAPGLDRFETQNLEFHKRLRQEFLDIAARNKIRYTVLDANMPPDRLAQQVWRVVSQRFSI